MITSIQRALAALPVILVTGAAAASGASPPLGTWIDHTGRGAVEITDCNGALCGRVVWVKDAADAEGCDMQIIGNAKPVAGGKWDGGWIYDPERRAKFDVELTPIGDQKLKVHGYAGMKFLGETMTWTRAPADLPKCGKGSTVEAKVERPAQPATEVLPIEPKREDAPAAQPQAEQMPSRSADAAPAREPAREDDKVPGLEALGKMLKFSESTAGRGKKTCTVSLMDLGKLSFPC